MKGCINASSLNPAQKASVLKNWDDMYNDAIKAGLGPISAETRVLKAMLDQLYGVKETNVVKARQAVMMKHIEQELLDTFDRQMKLYEEQRAKVKPGMMWAWDRLFKPPTQGKVYRDLLESVKNRRETIHHGYMRQLGDLFDEIGEKDLLAVVNDPALMKEAYTVALGGKSGHGPATKVGKAFRAILDQEVKDRWAAGALAHKMDDYAPQKWEPGKFTGTTENRTKFRNEALDRFDWERMIDPLTNKPFLLVKGKPTPAEAARMDEFIHEMYEDVYTDGARRDWRTKQQGKVPHGRGRAIYRPEARIVRMKTDDFFFMNEEWGWGNDNLLNLMMAHIDGAAADLALMQKLGPMAGDSHEYFSKGFVDPYSHLSDMMFNTLARSYAGPANLRMHGITVGVHSLVRSSLLGGSVLSAPSDMVMAGHVAAMNGLSRGAVGTGVKYMQNFLTTGMRSGDRMSAIAGQNAYIIGQSITEATLATQRYGGEATLGKLGKTARGLNQMSSLTMKLSGLQKATTDLADTVSMGFAGDLGAAVKVGRMWDALDEDFRRAALVHGIDANRWNNHVLKGVPHTNRGNDWFLDYRTVPDIETGRRLADWNAALRSTVTNTPDLRLRAVMTGGANLGTWRRVALTSMFMLKSWPIMVVRNMSLPLLNMALQGRVTPLAAAATTLFATGMLTIQLKNIIDGREPEALSTDLARRAFLQGGIGGLVFDLAAQDQGFLNSMARKVGGPVVGMADDLASIAYAGQDWLLSPIFGMEGNQKLGKEILRVMNRYTPLGNLWYAQAAVDRLIYNTVAQLPGVDPDFWDRRANIDQKLMNERGQDYWWRSTSSMQTLF